MLKKRSCYCNCRPPLSVGVYRPNYYPHYDMDDHSPYSPPHHDMDHYKPYSYPKQDMDYRKPYSYSRHDMEYYKPYPEPKHEMETIVKCGMGMSPGPLCSNGVGIGNASANGYHRQSPVIASVSLDTKELKDPIVKIDFSSIISFKTCAYGGGSYFLHLAFKLSKICDGGKPITLGIWNFEKSEESLREGSVPVDGSSIKQEIDSFCFTWCQCEGCPGCCNYVVELVDQDCCNIEFATISNITITGIAHGLKKVY